MKKIKKSSQKGFSLVECMIALGFLAITMLGVIQLFGVSIRQNSFARYNTVAVVVAQECLENLQAEFNNEWENGVVSANLTAGNHGPQTITLPAPAGSGSSDRDFQLTWTVNVSGSAKTVTASVAPMVANGFESKTMNMTAVFSQ